MCGIPELIIFFVPLFIIKLLTGKVLLNEGEGHTDVLATKSLFVGISFFLSVSSRKCSLKTSFSLGRLFSFLKNS